MHSTTESSIDTTRGLQRHTIERLQQFQALEYGMFIHFGMSTYDGDELSKGDKPPSWYQPDQLDVDQWVLVAADSGMKYAVLTVKHVAGHCLWPSAFTDYHVGAKESGNRTDVVEAFVLACERHGIQAGIYYCSWDNHNLFGSATPTFTGHEHAFTTQTYRDFQQSQLAELTERYGPFAQYWIDIPGVLGPAGRIEQYKQLAELAPQAIVVMNAGRPTRDNRVNVHKAWPADVLEMERGLPASKGASYVPWQELSPMDGRPPGMYYVPAEYCDTLGAHWFAIDGDVPRTDAELLGMRLLCRERGANFLLNVPPGRSGLIEQQYIDALARLTRNLDLVQT